jgi:serine/threonine-protein kinase
LLIEYHSGQDLNQFVKQNGAQAQEKVLRWTLEIADILEYLHGQDPPIIHRDVTPENLFVCYSGAVHVIYFGIATTIDRIRRTEVGTVRGKFEYLAPEQIASQPLDRRVDVFALGVVLFELATGRRLFRRDNQAATMMAVLTDPVPPLSSFRPGAPEELEAVCARALAKDRRDRYATAAEMRRDLLACARKTSDDDLPEALGARMRVLFSDRIAEKAEMLSRVRQGTAVGDMPAAEVDVNVELGTVCDRADPSSPEGVLQPQKTNRRRLLGGLALVALSLGMVGALATWRASRATPTQGALATPTPPASAIAAPIAPAGEGSESAFAPSASLPVEPTSVPATPHPRAPARARGWAAPPHASAAPLPAASHARPAPTIW